MRVAVPEKLGRINWKSIGDMDIRQIKNQNDINMLES